MLFCISVGIALLMAVILFRLIFSNLPDFLEYLFRPGPATFKVVVWAALVVITGILAYKTLPRHIPQLARHREAKPTVATAPTSETDAKPVVVQARTASSPQTTPVATPPGPPEATARGVKLGDTVQISAIQPAIALRAAVITSMDNTQLTVRANSGTYSVLWKDLTTLKAAIVSTNKAAP